MKTTLSCGGFLAPSITVVIFLFSYHTAQGYDPHVCEKPTAEAGDCSITVKKWTYDCKTNKCDSFEYSGCGGNQNRFDSKDACESTCKNKKPGCLNDKLSLGLGRSLDDQPKGSSSSSSSSEEDKTPDSLQKLR